MAFSLLSSKSAPNPMRLYGRTSVEFRRDSMRLAIFLLLAGCAADLIDIFRLLLS
jgi:hypothetical protein